MTAISDLKQEFCKKVCEEINIIDEGKNRFRIFTPFRFGDGDYLSIVLKQDKHQWIFSDEGNTLMHLAYSIDEQDLLSNTRQEIILNSLSEFGLVERFGELLIYIDSNDYGVALYDFIQALLRIDDVTYLSRERVKSTFYEDFQNLIVENVPLGRYFFDWYNPSYDPEGIFKVNCYINGMERPIYMYALANDDRTRDATISLLQFKEWDISFQPVAVFQNEKKITKNVLKRFSKTCSKRFPNFYENKREIIQYIYEYEKLPSSQLDKTSPEFE